MDTLSLSDIINENTEFIPLMTSDEEVEIQDDQLPELLPYFAFAKYGDFSWCCCADNRRSRQESSFDQEYQGRPEVCWDDCAT